MTVEHLRRLGPRTWLSDELINIYIDMLSRRDSQLCQQQQTRKPSIFFHSQFIGRLLEGERYDYTRVKNWTNKVSGSISSCTCNVVGLLLLHLNVNNLYLYLKISALTTYNTCCHLTYWLNVKCTLLYLLFVVWWRFRKRQVVFHRQPW